MTVPPELLGPEARRFVVLERGPDLWRILDRRTELVDYVRFGGHAFAIAPVALEVETRGGDNLRAQVIRRLGNALRRTDPSYVPPAELVAQARADADRRYEEERRQREAEARHGPPEVDAGYLWNLYLGRTP